MTFLKIFGVLALIAGALTVMDSPPAKLFKALATGKQDECFDRMVTLLNNFLTDPIVIPTIFNSGKGINDLGDYDSCNSNNKTRYILMEILGLTISVGFGICGPAECQEEHYNERKEEIAHVMNATLAMMGLNFNITKDRLRFTDSSRRLSEEPIVTWGFVVSMAYVGLILVLTIIGTVIASLYRMKRESVDSKEPMHVRILCCFDFYQNITSVFALSKTEEEDLKIFNGIRVTAMAWVILGHIYFYSSFGFLYNPADMLGEANKFWKCYLSNAVYAVDIFFLLSGFLSAYLLLKQITQRKGNMPYAHIYIHRYLRLLPLYFAMTIIFCYVIPLFGDGPAFHIYHDLVDIDCKNYSWMNFLFINNFAPYDSNCMGWVWYLANDMQFFLITPLLVLLYYKCRRVGLATIILIALGCMGFSFYMSMKYKLSVSTVKYSENYFKYYYDKPHNRIIPYLIGVLAGFLYLAYKQGKKTLFTRFADLISKNWVARWILYVSCVTVLFMLIHAMYWMNNYPDDWSVLEDTIYLVFSKPIFAIALLLLLLPMMLGHGNAMRTVFAHKVFTPFARTTYGAYLFHPMLMLFFHTNDKKGIYYEFKLYHFQFFAYFITSYLVSFVVTPIFESPIVSFDRQFLRPARRRSTLKNMEPPPALEERDVEKGSLLVLNEKDSLLRTTKS